MFVRNLPEQWNENIDPYLQIFNRSGGKIYQSSIQDATPRPIFNPSFNWIENEVLLLQLISICNCSNNTEIDYFCKNKTAL